MGVFKGDPSGLEYSDRAPRGNVITHRIQWGQCLSNIVFPAVQQGFKNRWTTEKEIHFFWGLGAFNVPDMRELEAKGIDYYIIDVGYIGVQIHRYPIPKIKDHSKTYFRICKNGLHDDLTDVTTDDTRYKKLLNEGHEYIKEIENYKQKEVPKDGHILHTPSSNGVCNYMHKCKQYSWIHWSDEQIKKYTDKRIEFRNKPKPNNKWWKKDIREDLKGASALVTNMSLSAIDAAVCGVPIICHKSNICASLGTNDYSKINELKTPTQEELKLWATKAANRQFTLAEIADGTAYEYLK